MSMNMLAVERAQHHARCLGRSSFRRTVRNVVSLSIRSTSTTCAALLVPLCAHVHARRGSCKTSFRQCVIAQAAAPESATPMPPSTPQAPRDDEILPDSLADALSDAAAATAQALQRSTNRARVEIIMPEFWDPVSGPIFPDSGDTAKFWKMVRRYIDNLTEAMQATSVKVLFPDLGVALMCRNWWPDATFQFASVQDRNPVQSADELIIFASPDPYGAESCRKVVRQIVEQDEAAGCEQRPMVMFNPRLVSGDAGIGLNYRRLQADFLNTFMVTYSLQPYGDEASVFRMYPRPWMLFLADPDVPGRFLLAKELQSRPSSDDIAMIAARFARKQSGVAEDAPPTVMEQVSGTIRSLTSFMRQLSQ